MFWSELLLETGPKNCLCDPVFPIRRKTTIGPSHGVHLPPSSNSVRQSQLTHRVRLRQGSNQATTGGLDTWEEYDGWTPFSHKDNKALIPGHYLPKLIQMLNCIRPPLFWPEIERHIAIPFYKVESDFQPSSEIYYRDNWVTERLVRGLKGLRQFQVFGDAVFSKEGDPLPEYEKFVSKNQPVFKTEFSITGLSEAQAHEILQESNLPFWKTNSSLSEGRRLISHAKILEGSRDYSAAYGDLKLSQAMIDFMGTYSPSYKRMSRQTILKL